MWTSKQPLLWNLVWIKLILFVCTTAVFTSPNWQLMLCKHCATAGQEMVPDQTGFSPCGITDHCVSKCSCLNRDFILAVPTLPGGGNTVYRESCTLCIQYAVGLCRVAVIVSQVWNLGSILAHGCCFLWIAPGERQWPAVGYWCPGEGDTFLTVLFPENSLELNRERSCGLYELFLQPAPSHLCYGTIQHLSGERWGNSLGFNFY